MYNYTSLFTHHDDFELSGIKDNHIVITIINSVTLPNAIIINDNTRVSDSVIEYHESNNLAANFYKNYTFEINI